MILIWQDQMKHDLWSWSTRSFKLILIFDLDQLFCDLPELWICGTFYNCVGGQLDNVDITLVDTATVSWAPHNDYILTSIWLSHEAAGVVSLGLIHVWSSRPTIRIEVVKKGVPVHCCGWNGNLISLNIELVSQLLRLQIMLLHGLLKFVPALAACVWLSRICIQYFWA